MWEQHQLRLLEGLNFLIADRDIHKDKQDDIQKTNWIHWYSKKEVILNYFIAN